jgi:cell division protein FtsL
LLQAGKNYVEGTAAVKLEYDVYSENKVLSKKKEYKANKKIKLRTVCLMLTVFAMGLLLMYRYALITEINYKVSSVESDYNKLRNENSRMKVQIEEQSDLSEIKEVAENKLGMQKPDKYQVVFLNVPKSDFTVVNDVYISNMKSEKGMFALLADKVSRAVKFLY